MTNDKKLVGIAFSLKVTDGYPPMNEEVVAAKPMGDEKFAISAIPFFVTDLAHGDIVLARSTNLGVLTYESILQRSANKTVQIKIRRKNHLRYLVEFLERNKLSWDAMKGNVYLAVSCASEEQYEKLSHFLEIAYERDYLDYVTSRV